MSDNNDYRPQKFPKPNTIPSGWDFSGLDNASNDSHKRGDAHKTASSDADHTDKMETFPKTSTYPGQWDLSGLTD